MKITKYLQCGIYDTEATLTIGYKHVTLTTPQIKWVNNSGTLDFCKIKMPETIAKKIRELVASGNSEVTDQYGDVRDIDDYLVELAMDCR